MEKGLINCYNNCFLNSVIQMLRNIIDCPDIDLYGCIKLYQKLNPNYVLGNQEDADECLSYLLEDFPDKSKYQITCIQKDITSIFNILNVPCSDNLSQSLSLFFNDGTKISIYPEYIFITLKRFTCTDDYRLKKITKTIEVPDIIKIGDIEYELISFIYHSGVLENGHYFTFRKINNKWYKFDDLSVTEEDPLFCQYMGYIYLFKMLKDNK